MRKMLLLAIGALLLWVHAHAQTRTISGKVTDASGSPVANASVLVKNSSVGTTTKADGTYSITVPDNAKVLLFSSVGMAPFEVTIGTNTSIDASLKLEDPLLTEVVVVAYGTQKKADLTGAVATVKAQDIENKPFSSVDKALQGQVAGLQSVAGSGQPGSSQAILIRGVSSITAATGPLWVIDGIPVNTGDASRLQTTSNLLSTLNPNDIESISVLKDAASQSIYGSRAANGVIVVTTKRGKSGKTRLRLDTEIGQSDIAYENDKYRPLNAADYLAISREGLVNGGFSQATIDATLAGRGLGNGIDFDWYDATTRTANQQQYNIALEGGNEKTTFYLSGGHFFQEGTTVNSKLNRTNGNLRITHKPINRMTVSVNMNGGNVVQRAPLNGGAFGNPVLSSYFLLPTYSAYNADKSYNLGNLGGLHNTVALADIDKRFLRELSLRGSVVAEYEIMDNLKFRTSYGIDYNVLEEDQYNNPLHGDGAASNGRAFSYYTRLFNWVWTNTLDYSKELTRNGDLVVNAQLGYESQKSATYNTTVQSQDFPPALNLTYPSAGARPTTATATISEYTFNGAFISSNFNYKNRYVISGSFRRDGSSRFGVNNKYGNFWSVGASWNVEQEAFMERVTFIDQLKLRSSYGVNGNAGIGNYDWLTLYNYGNNYNQQPGSAPSNVGDSSLTWELNKPFNVGIDVSVLKNRVNVSVDYYTRKSEDLLLNVPLSRTSGFANRTQNLGTMENKGIEITLNATPVKTKNFSWIVDFNFANNKNEITSLPGGNDIADGNFIIRQGAAYRTFFLRTYAGVDPANGNPLWYNEPTHSTTTSTYPSAATRELQGTALPKYFGSFTNSFNFKGFSLEAQFYYNFGNYVYDTWGGYYLGSGFGAAFNKVSRIMDRWQKANDVTQIPRYVEGGNRSFQSAHTFWVNKGDYIRLRNIQLGYNIPSKIISKAKMTSAFFYVRGTNLWTWVKDDNLPFDPEQGTTSATNLNVFIPKTVTVGLNLAF